MFNSGNTKYNNNSGVSINTKLLISFSDTCQLLVSGWNENLSLKFSPLKNIDENGVRQYAQEKSEIITTSLTPDNAYTLSKGIDEFIYPALKENKKAEVSVSISSGENRKVLKVETENGDVTLLIYLGVDENGVSTGDKIVHKFNKREFMTEYDPSTGKNTSITVNADFENFVDKIKSVNLLSAAVPHAINYNNAIKAAYKSNYNNNSNSNNNNYSAPTTNYNSMEDFIPFN